MSNLFHTKKELNICVMKLNSKEHWNELIYGLIYPGFVGSMIYELIPQTKSDATIPEYFTKATIIKIVITLFYLLDFLHLYGDMHAIVKPKMRKRIYLICDVLSSFFFFFAFVAVKLDVYWLSIIFVSLIPLWFLLYKVQNKFDKYFHSIYLIVSLLGMVLFCANYWFNLKVDLISNQIDFLLYFVSGSFVIYLFYVFYYYEYLSKSEDAKIYLK